MARDEQLSPTSIILVPGGWHTAYHLGPIINALEKIYGATLVIPEETDEYNHELRQSLSAWTTCDNAVEHQGRDKASNQAYRILPCPLYAAGPKQERHARFKDDVEVILNLLRSEATDPQRQICILAHSAAGIAVLQAINEYLDTATPSALTQLQHLICVSALCGGRNNGAQAGIEAGWISIDTETDLMHVYQTERYFFNDMSPEAAKPFSEALVPHVMGEAATRAELMTGEAFREVPNKTYVVCTQDAVVPPEFQEVQALEHGMNILKMDSAHCPFISRPEEFAQTIHRIISATTSGNDS